MIYQACCQQSAAADAEFNLCPACETLLIRCGRCSSLCDADDFCHRCVAPTCEVDVGRTFRVGDALAFVARVANRGSHHAMIKSVRYGLNCGLEFPHEKVHHRLIASSEVTSLFLDGMEAVRPGHHSLSLEIEFDVDGRSFRFRGEGMLKHAGVVREMPENVQIDIAHVDKAADVYINVGRDENVSGDPVEEWQGFALERIGGILGASGISRATEILVPDYACGEPTRYFLTRSSDLTFGVARPEKHPPTNVCIRLVPEREGVNLECNEVMSRVHFAIRVRNGELYLIDQSRNGTTVNGRRIPLREPWLLREGDQIAPFTDPRLIRHSRWRVAYRRDGQHVRAIEFLRLGSYENG